MMNDEPRPPRRPITEFLGPDGKNPFADDGSAAGPNEGETASEPFASPSAEAVSKTPDSQGERSGEYEQTIPHRGTAVLSMGIIGFLGATVGAVGLICCLPFPLFALAVSTPAWLMGRIDLKAMDHGVMDPAGRKATLVGYWLGLLGTVIGVLICAVFGVWFGRELLR